VHSKENTFHSLFYSLYLCSLTHSIAYSKTYSIASICMICVWGGACACVRCRDAGVA
jgi:hypothetical protein